MRKSRVVTGLALAGFLLLGGTSAMTAGHLDVETLARERCTQCHGFGRVERAIGQKDRKAWEITVDRMIGKRAGLLDSEERQAVIDYFVN